MIAVNVVDDDDNDNLFVGVEHLHALGEGVSGFIGNVKCE
jgi:hypothetical protein